MAITRDIRGQRVVRRSAQILILCSLLVGTAHSQTKDSKPAGTPWPPRNQSIDDVIEKAKQDDPDSIYYVERIADAKAVQAIPMLEAKYLHVTSDLDKGHIASVLVRLGDKDNMYWDYLVKQASPAGESDAPTVVRPDDERGPSDEFVKWAAAHNMTTDDALGIFYDLSKKVFLLAETGDQRGIPLLRKALSSPYFLVQGFAAQGLAQIPDKDSVPLMIEACQRSPAAAAALIAQSLVYFEDPRAQAAVDKYVPKDLATALRDAVSKGKKPFGNIPASSPAAVH